MSVSGGRRSRASSSAMWARRGDERVAVSMASSGPSTSGYTCAPHKMYMVQSIQPITWKKNPSLRHTREARFSRQIYIVQMLSESILYHSIVVWGLPLSCRLDPLPTEFPQYQLSWQSTCLDCRVSWVVEKKGVVDLFALIVPHEVMSTQVLFLHMTQ